MVVSYLVCCMVSALLKPCSMRASSSCSCGFIFVVYLINSQIGKVFNPLSISFCEGGGRYNFGCFFMEASYNNAFLLFA
jgi:hypothetical protein